MTNHSKEQRSTSRRNTRHLLDADAVRRHTSKVHDRSRGRRERGRGRTRIEAAACGDSRNARVNAQNACGGLQTLADRLSNDPGTFAGQSQWPERRGRVCGERNEHENRRSRGSGWMCCSGRRPGSPGVPFRPHQRGGVRDPAGAAHPQLVATGPGQRRKTGPLVVLQGVARADWDSTGTGVGGNELGGDVWFQSTGQRKVDAPE